MTFKCDELVKMAVDELFYFKYLENCPSPEDPCGQVIIFDKTAVLLCSNGSTHFTSCTAGVWKPKLPLCKCN